MITLSKRSPWLSVLALLLVLPAFFFIVIAIMKFELGMNQPFDAVSPWLESMGLQESPGWNINLLILFGPVIAVLISLFQVTNLQMNSRQEFFQLNVTVQKKWMPLFTIFLGGMVLAFLFIYIAGENCSC